MAPLKEFHYQLLNISFEFNKDPNFHYGDNFEIIPMFLARAVGVAVQLIGIRAIRSTGNDVSGH